MDIKINLNEIVKVKLTDLGKYIYFHRFDAINAKAGETVIQPRWPKVDGNGYTSFQLWEFMAIYGEHLGLTMLNVIEPLEIIYEYEEPALEVKMPTPSEKVLLEELLNENGNHKKRFN